MKSFNQYMAENSVTYKYDRNAFVKLPWNWQAMQQAKIVNALFYYAKENYVNGKPEQMPDSDFSLITLPNLKSIPPNELSPKNLISGRPIDQNKFVQMLKNPQTWYDNKIDQIYEGIRLLNKRPEDFGGKDIRPQAQAQTQQPNQSQSAGQSIE